MQHPPKYLQSILWSTNVKDIALTKDKAYIIHQILSYGGIRDWVWLFKTYNKKEIIDVFIQIPYKDYRESRFLFITKFLLQITDTVLDEKKYVKNLSGYSRP